MLPTRAVAGGSGLRSLFAQALVNISSDLCSTDSQVSARRAAHSFHTKTQEVVSSCRIPSPSVPEVYGGVHLREGLTNVDGPGLRYLVVLPSSQSDLRVPSECSRVSSKAVANELCHLRPYLVEHNGGVSIASATPSQREFCISIFREAHALDLTTCLQTTAHAAADGQLESVLAHTDVVGLDVRPRHCPSDVFNGTKEWGVDQISQLSQRLTDLQIPYFLRYVLVPGVTDQPHDIDMLMHVAELLKPSLQGIQLLPYHLLGGSRWQGLGYGQPTKGRIQPFKIEAVQQLVKRMKSLGLDVLANMKPA